MKDSDKRRAIGVLAILFVVFVVAVIVFGTSLPDPLVNP